MSTRVFLGSSVYNSQKMLKEENAALNKQNIDLHAIITKFTLGEFFF